METTTQALEETTQQVNSNDNLFYKIGVFLALISFAFFYLVNREGATIKNEGFFFLNYALFISYFMALLINKCISFFGKSSSKLQNSVYPLMVLATISCFSLNTGVNIFHDSCVWLQWVLVIFNCCILLIPYQHKFPKFLQIIIAINIGIAFLINLYFAIFLLPLYPISILAVIALGFGVHTFIPLFNLLILTSYLINQYKEYKQYVKVSFYSMLLLIIGLIAFVIKWNAASQQFNTYKMEQVLVGPSEFPEWMNLAQHLKVNQLNKEIILADLLFIRSSILFEDWSFFPELNTNLESQQTHNPLVAIALLFSQPTGLLEHERIKILESNFDGKHLTEQRLWTGKNLVTQSVVSNIRIYPKQRMVYTEKTLSIANTLKNNEWSQQEAIYTFTLPEGSAISSLSLWINGKEEKAVLTSKHKAENAYNTIVGVQRRDPSVIHWQEGNSVSIRIFPCTSKENRQVKIGITSPLLLADNKLHYQNIHIKGPNPYSAKEIIQVNYMDEVEQLNQPKLLKPIKNSTYKGTRTYNDDLNITFHNSWQANGEFTFNNKSYIINEYKEIQVADTINTIYLDVNKSWTKKEWTSILTQLANKKIYVFDDNKTEVTKNNATLLFESLHSNNFSLIPIYKIEDIEHSIIISKSESQGASLSSLRDSEFYLRLHAFFKQQTMPIKCIEIGNNSSIYLRTLKEYRAIYSKRVNTVADAVKLIDNNSFPKYFENKNTVLIPNSKLLITETVATKNSGSTAPDHLLRLFAYNTILKDMKLKYNNNDTLQDEQIELAQIANVVSPVSSLIVLETKEDYDNNKIKNTSNGLGNATMHNEGAVPEPHEWALIILGLLGIIYFYKKPSYV